ncbi:MAG: hypothetical protein WC089_04030 [Candidatus Paceibacterota bacterium]
MKNNSKIQIILLTVLILMVGVILWSQGLGKNILITENQNNETLNNNKVVTEKKILSGDKAVVTSSRSVLNDLISKNSNGIIDQCNYGSDVYFRVYPDVWLADVPHVIYDLSGKVVASGGGYPAPGYIADPLFTKINSTCTKEVYSAEKTNIDPVLLKLFRSFTVGDTFVGGMIEECPFEGKTYYQVSQNAYDGGNSVFDSSGNIIGGTQGFTGKPWGTSVPNCRVIYVSSPNIWGKAGVNVYNLK